jgi:hypothetical protein
VAASAAAAERPAIQRPSAVSAVKYLNLRPLNELHRRRKTRSCAVAAPFSAVICAVTSSGRADHSLSRG